MNQREGPYRVAGSEGIARARDTDYANRGAERQRPLHNPHGFRRRYQSAGNTRALFHAVEFAAAKSAPDVARRAHRNVQPPTPLVPAGGEAIAGVAPFQLRHGGRQGHAHPVSRTHACACSGRGVGLEYFQHLF